MGRRSRDDRSGRPMEVPPGIAALRAWRQAERQRRAERDLREKVRARRQAAAEKRRARVEQEAALYETHVERALVHARDQLDRDEVRLHERISEISARRLVTPGSAGALLLAVGLLVAPSCVVDWFQHHKVRAVYGLMIAMGDLLSIALGFVLGTIWWETWPLPWFGKKGALADAQEELERIARRRERLAAGEYRVARPGRIHLRWDDTPFVIRFD